MLEAREREAIGSGPDADLDVRPYSRRQMHRRLALRVPVRVSTIDSARDPESGRTYFQTSEETSADVSRGGAFVATPEPIEIGKRLLIEIELPDGSEVQTLARVVWRRIFPTLSAAAPGERPGIGVEFTGGNAEGLDRLERFIEKATARRPKATEDATSRQLLP